MTNRTPEERIASLEAYQQIMAKEISEMRADIKEIRKAVTSWRGIVLGIVMTVSVIWTGAIGLFQLIRHKLGL